jgi:hypothetical protein
MSVFGRTDRAADAASRLRGTMLTFEVYKVDVSTTEERREGETTVFLRSRTAQQPRMLLTYWGPPQHKVGDAVMFDPTPEVPWVP